MSTMRLNKWLSDQGIASSRRKADDLIDRGVVSVNGKRVTEMGVKIDPEKDRVFVHGKLIEKRDVEEIYLVVHKPSGVVTTTDDELGRKTVLDLVDSSWLMVDGLKPVGRLDMDSRGLVLVTNDNEVITLLTQSRYDVEKEYEVRVAGSLEKWKLNKLRKGVKMSDGVTRACEVQVLEGEVDSEKVRRHWLQIILQQGKNRQIRRMCGALQLEVLDLKRVRLGEITLGSLAEGAVREFTEEELAWLKELRRNK